MQAVIYQCKQKWEDLQPTDDEQVRFCALCSQQVLHLSDVNGMQHAAATGKCVMVKPEEEKPILGRAGLISRPGRSLA